MKKLTKYLFIALFVVAWSLMYSELEKSKETDNDRNEQPKKFENITDSVKLKTNGNLNVYYLNVGQADAMLLENDGKYMLIDAGNNADGKNLVKYFNELGIKKFEYVIATHAHEDHIGGMDDIINSFKVDKFYMPDAVTTSKTFEDLLTALENNDVSVDVPLIGDIFIFGGCKFEVLYIGNESEDLNDTSIVIRGLYGDTSFLFTGDATSKVEKILLDKNIKSDVLKVGHHGSQFSTTVNFINKVLPKYAIISVGKDNSYGHPRKETIVKLTDRGATVYRTDKDGTIIVSSDGKKIKIDTSDLNLNG